MGHRHPATRSATSSAAPSSVSHPSGLSPYIIDHAPSSIPRLQWHIHSTTPTLPYQAPSSPFPSAELPLFFMPPLSFVVVCRIQPINIPQLLKAQNPDQPHLIPGQYCLINSTIFSKNKSFFGSENQVGNVSEIKLRTQIYQ